MGVADVTKKPQHYKTQATLHKEFRLLFDQNLATGQKLDPRLCEFCDL